METVYGNYSYSHTVMVELCNKFRKGNITTKDLACPGLVLVTASDGNVKQLETVLH